MLLHDRLLRTALLAFLCVHSSLVFAEDTSGGIYGAWQWLTPGSDVDFDYGNIGPDAGAMTNPAICVIDRDGIVVESWYGPVPPGAKIPLCDQVPQSYKAFRMRFGHDIRETELTDEILGSTRRIALFNLDDPDDLTKLRWADDTFYGSMFWSKRGAVFTYGGTMIGDELVSLPRWIEDEYGGFDRGPRMSEPQLRSRLMEAAVRLARRAAHEQEIKATTDANEYMAAMAAYRCEFGRIPFAFPDKSHIAPTSPWSADTWRNVTDMLSSRQFRKSHSWLSLAALKQDSARVKRLIEWQSPKSWDNLDDGLEVGFRFRRLDHGSQIADLIRSDGSGSFSMRLESQDQHIGRTRGTRTQLLPIELGWSAIAWKSPTLGWSDRVEFAKWLVLHEAISKESPEIPEQEQNALAVWAEQFADDGPLAKRFDKDIPFAQKFLGYQAGAYLMKFRRPKDAAPVEPVEPATKPDESRVVEPSPAHAVIAWPPSRWPSVAMAIGCLAIGAVLGRWSAFAS